MGQDLAFFSILRVYKNAAGDTIRIDEITMSGFFLRKSLFANWGAGRTVNPRANEVGQPRFTVTTPIFHANGRGRVVSTELLNMNESRTVAEIDMVGNWSAIAAAPNFTNVTWRGGVIDLTDLPVVTDTV